MICAQVTQLCPILCNPLDCSPPGSSGHGIFQARILEWVARLFFRGSSNQGSNPCLMSPTLQMGSLPKHHPGIPPSIYCSILKTSHRSISSARLRAHQKSGIEHYLSQYPQFLIREMYIEQNQSVLSPLCAKCPLTLSDLTEKMQSFV